VSGAKEHSEEGHVTLRPLILCYTRSRFYGDEIDVGAFVEHLRACNQILLHLNPRLNRTA